MWTNGCTVVMMQVVSAASIAAKVTRDRVISDWQWEAPALNLAKDFGSGYPSDPKYVTQCTAGHRAL